MPVRILAVVCAVLLGSARSAAAYSVLTHEAIIDSVWDDGIRPLLARRFHASPERLFLSSVDVVVREYRQRLAEDLAALKTLRVAAR